ncbi:MAG: phenylacetate--CoA ligase family protein [Ruminococcaceae bacterium]|nr:phenylacetate--CoA ligase family protein [Oscillospiraceae bacterium]
MSCTQKRLQRILEQAYEQVPYFNGVINDLIDEPSDINPTLLKKIPTFSKQDICSVGWENFVSGKFLKNDYSVNIDADIRLERTSGTTGNPMQILWKNSDYFASSRFHWQYRFKNFGITPNSRMCTTLRNLPGNDIYYINNKKNKFVFSIMRFNRETVTHIFAKLNEYQPEWLYIQNSVLYVLTYFAKKYRLKFPKSIRYIEFIGEPICNYYREKIHEIIPAPSSNMYGCVETNGISYECQFGNNHIISDNVLLEIVDTHGHPIPDGNIGYVCVTGLHNTGMPMIRYRLNDLATIKKQVCNCNNKNPIIDVKAGRMTEFLLLDDAAVFDKAKLFCPINAGLSYFKPKAHDLIFNLKMNTLDNYELLVLKNDHHSSDISQIVREMFNLYQLPNIRFSIKYTKHVDQALPIGLLRLKEVIS